MANKKITELSAASSVLTTDILPVVVDPGGSPITKKVTLATVATLLFASPTLTGTALAAAITASGTITANLFAGSGASLTNLPAANLTGTLPAISGANLTTLNGSNIASGTVPSANLPTSYSALSITTATVGSLTKTATETATINLTHGTGGYFLVMSAGSDFLGTVAPTGSSSFYLTLRVGTDDYYIKAQKSV